MTRQIVLACLLAGAPRTALTAQSPEASRLSAPVSRLIDSMVAGDAFSGVVVVYEGGKPVLQRATGYADVATQRRNDLNTAFNLGSINKLFTQIAIRQLEAEGRISRDSTLGFYWPDYPNVDARKATIQQLLTHRAGLGGNIFGEPSRGTRASIRTNRDFLPLFVNEPMAFAPGTSQRYCNACYVVLGELVTRISGEEYSRYVARHIWQPAGMSRTGYFPKDSLPPNTAIGYMRPEGTAGGRHPNTALLPGRGSAAGGGYSTAGDLIRLLQAMRDGRIAAAGPTGIGVAGGAPGTNAVLDGLVMDRYDLVVLSNYDPPSAENVASAVRRMLGAPDDDGPSPSAPRATP